MNCRLGKRWRPKDNAARKLRIEIQKRVQINLRETNISRCDRLIYTGGSCCWNRPNQPQHWRERRVGGIVHTHLHHSDEFFSVADGYIPSFGKLGFKELNSL